MDLPALQHENEPGLEMLEIQSIATPDFGRIAPNAVPIAQSTPMEDDQRPGQISAIQRIATPDFGANALNARPIVQSTPVEDVQHPGQLAAIENIAMPDDVPIASNAVEHDPLPVDEVNDFDPEMDEPIQQPIVDQAMRLAEFAEMFFQRLNASPMIQPNPERMAEVMRRHERRSVSNNFFIASK